MSWRALLPLVLFTLLATALYVGLSRDPRAIPSVLVGRPVPAFDLAALDPSGARIGRMTEADLARGRVSVLNVFASWCAPCREEMPLLADLAREPGIDLVGLVYKDKPQATARFLADFGDPFARLADDGDGRVGIDLGVYGVPETFVIDGAGRITFKHVGPLTAAVIAERLRPAIDAAKGPAAKGPAAMGDVGTGPGR